jgi:phenylacetate-CoA ligase
VGLPSYLKALLDLHAADGGTADDLPLEWALVTAEPLPDSLRAELQGWGLRVRMAYGTAEAGLIAYEDGAGPGLRTARGIGVEVCDIADGTPLAEGPGEVVVTILRESAPLVRFGTGDLSAWTSGGEAGPDAEAGATAGERRLAGVLGRTGQAVKVRGMFLHPAQVRAAAAAIPDIEGLRFVLDREDHRDTVVAEVVVTASADEAQVLAEAGERIRSALRFRADVRAVAQLPSDEPIDDRRTWD